VLGNESARTPEHEAALARLGELGATLATTQHSLSTTEAAHDTTKATLEKVTHERDALRRVYQLLLQHYELLRRHIYMARAERIDVTQLEIDFAAVKKSLDAMVLQGATTDEGGGIADVAPEPSVTTDGGTDAAAPAAPPPAVPPPAAKLRAKPKGRRNLADEEMPEERIEILDPVLEETHERVFFEDSYRLGHRRASDVRIVVARAVYKNRETGEMETVDKPKELVERGLLAPSMIAHLLVSKYRFGIPFHRLTEMFRAYGVKLDDSTMCRYAENIGATLGCIVDAMAKEAKETAFCLSTDATGVSIQPEPLDNGKRQACRKGHFFVVLADQDHIFFEYQPKHTGAAVCEMFRGYSGYIQADACAIYNALYRGEARTEPDDPAPTEVGCWAHAR